MGALKRGAARTNFVRAVNLMTAFSIALTSGTASFSQPADQTSTSTFRVQIGPNFSVAQGGNPQVNYCVIHGFRARASAGNEEGPLHLEVEQVFDEKGQPFLRGAGGLDLKHSTFTNTDDREIGVRIELDGKSYDLPSADVHVAVLTFLEFRFPVELLNTIAQASTMKIYTIEPRTKASVLFATAEIGSGKDAFPVLAKCTEALPPFPSQVASRWTVEKNAIACVAAPPGDTDLKVFLAPKADDKKEDVAVMMFTEKTFTGQPTPVKNPTIKIGSTSFAPQHGVAEIRNGFEHLYFLPARALDGFGPDVKFVLENDGRVQAETVNLVPEDAVSSLKTCAASIVSSAAKPSG